MWSKHSPSNVSLVWCGLYFSRRWLFVMTAILKVWDKIASGNKRRSLKTLLWKATLTRLRTRIFSRSACVSQILSRVIKTSSHSQKSWHSPENDLHNAEGEEFIHDVSAEIKTVIWADRPNILPQTVEVWACALSWGKGLWCIAGTTVVYPLAAGPGQCIQNTGSGEGERPQ